MTTNFDGRPLQVRPLILAALAAGLLLVALFTGAQIASAQQGTTWESGNFCVQDYLSNAVCTANDVRITNLTPSVSEACIGVGLGETTTVQFRAEVLTGATTRYSIGFFIAQDGASALDGNACYHDFLQPAVTSGQTPPVGFQTTGVGPFRNEDGNVCADTLQNDGNVFYSTQAPTIITCIDANNDGLVDPVSTCTSWEENANGTCSNVKGAFPGTPSKCNCSTVNTNIKIYRGLDGGDLPDTYGTLFTSNGACHAVQDPSNSGTPQTLAGQVAIWLGATVDYAATGINNETYNGGFPNVDALGDDNNNSDDENGVSFVGPWNNGGRVDVLVNASGTGECIVGNDCVVSLWLDWDGNGSFNNALFSAGGERYDFTLTQGTGMTYQLTFTTPATWNTPLAARVRLYDNAPSSVPISPLGLALNGEVEDYIVAVGPLAVVLSDFSATCEVETPVISWETMSEFDTQGFNLYRGPSAAGWDTQLNSALILAQHPGSTLGGFYQWPDNSAVAGETYYYYIEDVSLAGVATLHDPISAMCIAPTAVRLDGLDAASSTAAAVPWWTAALALTAVLGGAVAARRRTKA